jgi:D-alanine transaminase
VIVHLNGNLVPASEARVSVFDRGFVFGEGVYEGLRSFRGRVVAMGRHIERMRNGLRECRIDWDPAALAPLTGALLAGNSMPNAFIYWQVTRGAPGPGQAVRTRIPSGPETPTVFGYCTPQPPIEAYSEPPTVTAVTRPDTRWRRGHLKSISLLGNVLAAIEAKEAGAQDAILVRDGLVTEGTATNVILALPRPDGSAELATPSLESVSILAGVTRGLELDFGPGIVSRPVRAEDLKRATEIMLVGSTSMVTSVVSLDGRPVGDGRPGPQAHRLLAALLGVIRRELALDTPAQSGSTTGKPCRTSPAGV